MKLFELRRNPDINQVQYREDIIEKYYKSPNADSYFVHFTNIEKLGLRPDYEWHTLFGLHCYPLSEIQKLGGKSNWYGTDLTFMFVMKVDKEELTDLSTYKVSDLYRDCAQLIRMFPDREVFLSAYLDKEYKSNSPVNDLFLIIGNLIRETIEDNSNYKYNPEGIRSQHMTYILMKLGYKGFYDTSHTGYIARDIKNQALIFDLKIIEGKKLYRNVTKPTNIRISRIIEKYKTMMQKVTTADELYKALGMIAMAGEVSKPFKFIHYVDNKLLNDPKTQKFLFDRIMNRVALFKEIKNVTPEIFYSYAREYIIANDLKLSNKHQWMLFKNEELRPELYRLKNLNPKIAELLNET